jgi:hypothetical protein
VSLAFGECGGPASNQGNLPVEHGGVV